MSTELEVDPQVLTSVGAVFGQAADGLSGLNAGEPLADAAAAVPQLQTAAACTAAQTSVTEQMSTAVSAARRYRDDLGTAARLYESGDVTGGENIASAGF
jgi:hypothetical protein